MIRLRSKKERRVVQVSRIIFGILFCLSLSLGLSFSAVSQAAAMSLYEAIEQAVATHPDVLAAEENHMAAYQQVRQASAGYLPTLDLLAGYGRERSDNSTTRATGQHALTMNRAESGLALKQKVFDGSDVKYGVLRTQAILQAAKANLDLQTENVARRAVDAYLETEIRQAQLELFEKNVQTHEQILKKITQKFQGGAGTQADVYQAESRMFLASANFASAQTTYQNAQAAFLKVVGVLPEKLTRPATPDANLPTSLDGAKNVAMTTNPGILNAQHALTAATLAWKKTKAVFFPQLDMELAAANNNNVSGSAGHSQSASAMLRMEFNLFNGGADTARLRESVHLAKDKQQQLDSTRRTVIEQVEVAWNKLASARIRVGFLDKHVQVSQKVTKSYHDQFKLGQRTLLDLLNSETELFEAQSALLTEELTLIKTAFELLANQGILYRSVSGHARQMTDPSTSQVVLPAEIISSAQAPF